MKQSAISMTRAVLVTWAFCSLWLSGAMASQSPAAIEITTADYEGRAQFRIATAGTVWYYDKAGGGFSRLIDPDGRDWIAFRKDPLSAFPDSAAGGYRGLGNLVYGQGYPDAGAGHPGFDRCESTLIAPNVIRTVSLSGRWAWTWTFTETAARFRMERVDPEHPWWFLYEGTVGGHWSPQTHYWGTDLGGPRREVPGIRNQHFGQWRWAYFGDDASARVFFVAQRLPDELPDTLWYLGNSNGGAVDSPDGMIVFGLGRGPGTRPQFRDAGIEIVTGLVETAVLEARDHDALAAVIEAELAGEPTPRRIEIWHGSEQHLGRLGVPQRWFNVLGRVTPAEGLVSLSASLNDTAAFPLSIGTDRHRLAGPGDFNAEFNWYELRGGANRVTLAARWEDGSEATEVVTLHRLPERVWPLPWEVDFTQVSRLSDVAQVVDGRWRLTPDGVRVVRPYYDRVLAFGDLMWREYEAEVELILHDFTGPYREPPWYNVTHFGVGLRWTGHVTDGHQPRRQWYPLGAATEFTLRPDLSECRWRILPDGRVPSVYASATTAVERGRRHLLKARVETLEDGRTRCATKLWPVGAPEPADWAVESFEDETDNQRGGLLLVAHNSDVTFCRLRVRPIGRQVAIAQEEE